MTNTSRVGEMRPAPHRILQSTKPASSATPRRSAEGGERPALHDAIENAAVRGGIASAEIEQLREEFYSYCARADTMATEMLAAIIELREDLAEMRRRASRAAGSSLSKLPPGWVYLKQASFETGYHREHLRQLAIAKSIKGKRVGGIWRVILASAIAYANKTSSP